MRLITALVPRLVLAALLLAVAPARPDDGGGSLQFTGVIQALPAGGSLVGDWLVSGTVVRVSPLTDIRTEHGAPALGVTVEVRGDPHGDGSVDATRIDVKDGNAGPGPTPTATPTPDPGPEDLHFTGLIGALPPAGLVGDWTVGALTVHVSVSTRIETEGLAIALGATVEVEGFPRGDGSVDATKIEVRAGAPGGPGEENEGEIAGVVEALPGAGLIGDWTVSGRVVHVDAGTVVDAEHGVPAVGAFVEVKGTPRADGSLDAVRIEVKSSPETMPGAAPARAELRGTVEDLASTPGFVGDWVVSGTTVRVTDATWIDQEDGALNLGSLVEVKGTRQADGSVDARRVEVILGPAGAPAVLANTFFLPSSARSEGKGGSFYTTDLTISNTGITDATIEVRFLGHETDGRDGPRATLRVPAGTTLVLADALASLFGLSQDYGALRIASNVKTLVITAATSTPGGGGTFGQGHEALHRSELGTADRPRSIGGVRSDDLFRTNLVVVNATEHPVEVEIELLSDDGRSLGSTHLELQPLEMRQINDAPHALGASGELEGGRFLLTTPTPDGAFAAGATVIDNRTNDPRALSAR